MRPSETIGERAKGSAAFRATADQITPPGPSAAIPAPQRPPTSAWVVDTGRPVAVATISQPIAPVATAMENAGPAALANRPLPEKVATSPEAVKAARAPPAMVQAIPHTMDRR